MVFKDCFHVFDDEAKVLSPRPQKRLCGAACRSAVKAVT